MKKQMTIGRQFTLGFLVAMALVLALGYSARDSIGRIGRDLDTAVNVTARKMDLVGELQVAFQDMVAHTRLTQFAFVANHLVQPNARVGANSGCSMCHLWEGRETPEAELHAQATAVRTAISGLQPLITTENERKHVAAVQAGVDGYVSLFRQ